MFAHLCLTLLVFCLLSSKVDSQEEHVDAWSNYESGAMGQYPQVTYKSTTITTPQVHVTKPNASCDNRNHVFISPHAGKTQDNKILMYNTQGDLAWYQQEKGSVHNVQVQQYKGNEYITYWVGDDENQFWEHGAGYYKMLDHTYALAYTVQAVGIDGDYHEFSITPQDTAIITAYVRTPWNLTDQGRDNGYIWDCVFQEIDIGSGSLLFEWRASDHFKFSQMAVNTWSSWTGTFQDPWDWFHLNSVQKDSSGNFLIAVQHTNAIHCISVKSGKRLWQLGGGLQNTFTDNSSGGLATTFDNPQMARWETSVNDTNAVLTVLSTTTTIEPHQSQGLRIALDLSYRTAALLTTFMHPSQHLARGGGSFQRLRGNHNYLLSYGRTPVYSEFAPTGELLCDTHFAPVVTDSAVVETYRIYAARWKGLPLLPPVVQRDASAFYVHWNGATELRTWILEGRISVPGHHLSSYQPLGVYKTRGFETEVVLNQTQSFKAYRLTAKDARGETLGVWSVEQDGTVKEVVLLEREWLPHVSMMPELALIVFFAGALFFITKSLLARKILAALPTKVVMQEKVSRRKVALDVV